MKKALTILIVAFVGTMMISWIASTLAVYQAAERYQSEKVKVSVILKRNENPLDIVEAKKLIETWGYSEYENYSKSGDGSVYVFRRESHSYFLQRDYFVIFLYADAEGRLQVCHLAVEQHFESF